MDLFFKNEEIKSFLLRYPQQTWAIILEKLCLEGIRIINYKFGNLPDLSVFVKLKKKQNIELDNQLKEMEGKLEDLDSQLKQKELEFKTSYQQKPTQLQSSKGSQKQNNNRILVMPQDNSSEKQVTKESINKKEYSNVAKQKQQQVQKQQKNKIKEVPKSQISQVALRDQERIRKYKVNAQKNSQQASRQKCSNNPQICFTTGVNSPVITPFRSIDVSFLKEPELKNLSNTGQKQTAEKQLIDEQMNSMQDIENLKIDKNNEYERIISYLKNQQQNQRSKSSQFQNYVQQEENLQFRNIPQSSNLRQQNFMYLNKNSEYLEERNYGSGKYKPYSLAMALANFN